MIKSSVSSPPGCSERRNIPLVWQLSDCSHSLRWAQGNSGCEKVQGAWPQEMHGKNDFGEPRLLHLPIQSKVLNSFTWEIWFSLLHKNTFEVQATCPYLQTSIQPGSPSPPPTSLEHFSQGDLNYCLLNSHPIKHNSHHLGCDTFLQVDSQAWCTRRGCFFPPVFYGPSTVLCRLCSHPRQEACFFPVHLSVKILN